MYKVRQNNLRGLLEASGFSYYLITDSIDIEYLCGFCSSNAAVVVTDDECVLFSDFRYKLAAEQHVKYQKGWKFILIEESLFKSLGKYFSPCSTVGFQSNFLTVDEFAKLKRNSKKVAFKPLSNIITNTFIVKAKAEIKAMKYAAYIADTSFTQLLENINPEMTERQAACKLEMLLLELGAEGPSFDTIVLSGERSALPHGKPGDSKLRTGKFILFDFGCRYKGFCSDMTRVVVFGKASKRMKACYSAVLQAQLAACKAVKADMYTDTLDHVAREIIENSGYGDNFGHALGHGVGLRIHELPRISSHCHTKLKENSVVTIEPGIYIPGFGGVRIEDMVVVKKNGIEILTNTTKELIEL